MTAAVEWLSGERPPLPRREKAVIFDREFADRLQAVLAEPAWPSVDEDTVEMVPVQPRVEEPPTVEFRPIRNRARRLVGGLRRRLSWQRGMAAGASGLVLLASFLGWWQS